MNELNFYKTFNFNIFEFNEYHLTDHTKSPVTNHYFGCLIKGTAKIKTKNEKLELKPNEIFYIPKGLKYQSFWFGENSGKVSFYSFGFEISPLNKHFALQKINCSRKEREIFDDLCKGITAKDKCIGKLYYFFEEVASGMKLSEKPHINPITEKAIEYLTENPNRKISDVAKHCNISEPNIYLVFKKNLNKTPNKARNEILCNKAVLLLTSSNKSVEEISDTLGFSSTSYFRKILKAHTGKTPLEIRKESEF